MKCAAINCASTGSAADVEIVQVGILVPWSLCLCKAHAHSFQQRDEHTPSRVRAALKSRDLDALGFLLTRETTACAGVSLFSEGYASGTISRLRDQGLVVAEKRYGVSITLDYLTSLGRAVATGAP